MRGRLREIATRQGGVFSRSQALASGCSHDEIVRSLRDGRWIRIRRGQYAENAEPSTLPPWERAAWQHLRKLHAAMNSLRTGSVAASHQSALVLHGLPIWGQDLAHVHVTRLDGQSGGLIAGVRHHVGQLTGDDVTVAAGRWVTRMGRAVVETACTTSFEIAVVTVDAVLRAAGLAAGELDRLLDLIENWPGSPAARAAVRFGDGRAESVGESRLRVLLHEQDLPAPELQAEFRDRAGLIGRVDFYFAEYDLVLEFDGALKYGGGSPEILIREKRREDRLRALGLAVVRTDWSDLDRPAQLATTIRQALARPRTHRAA